MTEEETGRDFETGDILVNPHIVIRPEEYDGLGIRINSSSFAAGGKFLVSFMNNPTGEKMEKRDGAGLYRVVAAISGEGGLIPREGGGMTSETNLGYITDENLRRVLPRMCGPIELTEEGLRAVREEGS